MTRGKRALDAEFVFPGHHGGPVSRQTIALAAVVLAVVFGGIAIEELGSERRDVWVVTALVGCVGVAGGAFYHRIRRFWWRGAASGLVIALGAFGADRSYSLLRQRPLSVEFAVLAALGGVPGVFLYRWLMRRQVVTEEELRAAEVTSRRTSA